MAHKMTKELLFESIIGLQQCNVRWHSVFWFIEFVESNPFLEFTVKNAVGFSRDVIQKPEVDLFVTDLLTKRVERVTDLAKDVDRLRSFLGLPPMSIIPDRKEVPQQKIDL